MDYGSLIEVAVNNSSTLLVPEELRRVFTNFESLSSIHVSKFLKAGEVFVDVGANFGFYSVLASSIVKASGKVIAIEPSPLTLQILKKNIGSLDNVLVVPFAISTNPGFIEFYHSDDYVNSGSAYPPFIKQDHVTKILVNSKTLDEILQLDLRITDIDFLKIDVQGDDVDVLNSSKEILSRSKKVKVLVEWAPTWMKNSGRDPMDLPSTLSSFGFKNLICIDDWQMCYLSIDEFYNLYKQDQSGKRFCNIFAQR